MLSSKMSEALNAQINAEYYSSYLYLSMAAWSEEQNLPGLGNWFRIQVQEEMGHTMKFFDFVIERGGRVSLGAIDGPETEWDSPTAIFEATLKHEQYVTSLINKLVDLALAESDHATNTFLQWFVTEQVEEEASVNTVLHTLKRMGDAAGGLFMLDRELSQRVFTPPTPAQ